MNARWTPEEAWAWYRSQPWLVGCNFTPSTAINQLEFWQAESFDLPTIKRELGWAADLGMNTLRVYLHDLAYEADPDGFLGRVDTFLSLCEAVHIRPMFVFFDDCWNPDAKVGPQPEPKPGVHNSGWLQSPGHAIANDPRAWPRLKAYVQAVLGAYREDKRVLAWDLYNEPGNGGQELKSLPLVEAVFDWAREVGPVQPLTTAVWGSNQVMDKRFLQLSDFVSFHFYEPIEVLDLLLDNLRASERPLICSEWLARTQQNVVECLQRFHDERIGCMNWGFVAGKTNTKFPWGSPEGAPEPDPWFHELLRADGSPYREDEANAFRELKADQRGS